MRRVMLSVFLGPLVLASPEGPTPDAATPVAVRNVEGELHGFLVMRTLAGARVAHGDLLQLVRNGQVESRMVFRFDDGSLFDERVSFTDDSVFIMRKYTLVQRGPAFPDDEEITLERASGRYHIVSRGRTDDHAETHEGTLDLPADVYNGMVITIAKNLVPAGRALVHIVAFTPAPRLVQLEIAPVGAGQVRLGGHTETTAHYVFKPRLGVFIRLFAILGGRSPSDANAWIVTDDVPAFVRIDGALSTPGTIWRVELATPTWPDSTP
ncbi:MAG TPA: hypothetical protein VL563_15495 [Gemmatimonadales bacterium]|nr:hypothetical protein [Gemmatimonadales bacterium]